MSYDNTAFGVQGEKEVVLTKLNMEGSRKRRSLSYVGVVVVKTASLLADGGVVMIANAGSEVTSRANVTDLQQHGIHRGDRTRWVPQVLWDQQREPSTDECVLLAE